MPPASNDEDPRKESTEQTTRTGTLTEVHCLALLSSAVTVEETGVVEMGVVEMEVAEAVGETEVER